MNADTPHPDSPERTYTCASCGGTFAYVDDEEWSDDDAKQELADNFGDLDPADCAIVCDDCYNGMTTATPPPMAMIDLALSLSYQSWADAFDRVLTRTLNPMVCEIRLMEMGLPRSLWP